MKNVFILNNGNKIPSIGYGTWQSPNNETTLNAVIYALDNGYRHIDTAAVYGNEKIIGEAIKISNVNRNELFVTSKVWNTERGYESTIKACEKTLKDLQLDYLDLYLIHWPCNSKKSIDWRQVNIDTWNALIHLYKIGKVRAIGVSNFKPHQLVDLLKCEIIPMVNQIEYHPGLIQKETIEFCKKNNILVEAWSPLGTGKLLDNKILKEISLNYNKSIAQLCIKWCLQNDVLPLPKSVTPNRISENINISDFTISKEDMNTINLIEYCGGSGLDSDEIEF